MIYNASSEGSVYAVAKRQAEFLVNLGARVTVISNQCPVSWQGVDTYMVDVFDRPVWRFLDYILIRMTNRLPGSWKKKWDMHRVLSQYRFPFSAGKAIAEHILSNASVHACVCIQHFAIPGLMPLKNKKGIPLILLALGDIFDHPNTAFSLPTNVLYRHAAKVSYRMASLVVAVGQQLRQRAIECGASPDRVCVIPNGIDLEHISSLRKSAAIRKKSSALRLLYVGRLSPEKGVDILLRSLADIRQCSIHLQVIGDGPEKKFLQNLASELEIVDQIEFMGHVSEAVLWESYNSSDIAIIPSYADALPLVSLEAQAFGLPVIASNIGGLPDVIENGVNGVLVPAGDVNALSAVIKSMHDDPEMRQRMSMSSLDKVTRFDWQHVLNSFANKVLHIKQRA